MKGLVLAGGTGQRLWPLTLPSNKHLMPIYDKPLIYYPISTLMLAGIRDIALVTSKLHFNSFKNLFENVSELGIKITLIPQESPGGLPQGFILAESFIGEDAITMILGDNIFYGTGIGPNFIDLSHSNGAKIYLYEVANPNEFGVAEIESDKIVNLTEKPSITKSNKAISGLYIFDNKVIKYAKNLNPSKRGELEMVDLLMEYHKTKNLNYEIMSRGIFWLDAGTFESLSDASQYIRLVQTRQGLKIGCIEEISWRKGWISDEKLIQIAKKIPNPYYSRYLLSLLK